MSLRTISEVSNSASNINSRSSRSILGYSNISPTKDHKRNQIRNKLDYFYMDNNSQASSKVVSPKASANVVNIEQNMNHQALINSTKMINNLVLKKWSFGSNRNTPADYSIRTSPFNKDPLDTNTNSSWLRSTKGFQSEAKQEDQDNWNEDELYNLSQEKSYQTNPHEIIEIETQGDPERNSIDVNEELNEYINAKNPFEMKPASPVLSQNSNDLNKLLYNHKREESNGICSSNVYSDVYRSNQASVADNYNKMRGSEEQSFTNYIWNRYHQRMHSYNQSQEDEEIVLKSGENQDFQYKQNENTDDTENQLYDGMNFEEYYKNATEAGEQNAGDHKLAITDEQRENLMRRIMILKMQQNSTISSQDEMQINSNTHYKSQLEEEEEDDEQDWQ